VTKRLSNHDSVWDFLERLNLNAERENPADDLGRAYQKIGVCKALRQAGLAPSYPDLDAREASAIATVAVKWEVELPKHYESERQRKIAQNPRPDALQRLIIEIVRKDSNATWKDVLKKLEKREHSEVIDTIDEEKVEWTDDDGSIKDTAISALKDRVSRAKKFALAG
jgi:hypothetical protein